MDTIRFAHISDLHFQRRTVDIVEKSWHSLMVALEWALLDLKVSHLVVSGDVSATGAAEELILAATFLTGRLALGMTALNNVGLGGQIEKLLVVPGNHDHWRGRRWPLGPGYNAPLMGPIFKKTPWAETLVAGQLRLELFGLDSSSGNRGIYSFTPLQGGRVSDKEWTKLDEELIKVSPAAHGEFVVGALVLHHSLCYRGGLPRWRPPQAYALHDDSKKRIRELAADGKISAVLTGHTHDFWMNRVHGSGHLRELRSDTTLCGPPQPNTQGFLLHKLTVEPKKGESPVVWRPRRYAWDGRRFICDKRYRYEFRPRLLLQDR